MKASVARRLAPFFGLVCAVGPTAHAQPEAQGRAMTLEECVGIALTHHPDALSSDYDVANAEAARAGVRGQFGPKIEADGSFQQWSSGYSIPFSFPSSNGGTTPVLFTVRDVRTWTAGVTATQPLTPLWSTFEQYKVETLGVDVAAIKRVEVRRQVAYDAVQAYYRLLEAERLADVANASVTQLEAEERQAQSNYTNGVIAKNDLLRATLALASARQRRIQAGGTVVLARAELAHSMGLPPDAPIEAAPFAGDPPALEDGSLAAAEAHALARRAEVFELSRRIDQAQAAERLARTKLLPQLSAVGNYTHTEGSPFSQVDAEYVGLVGSWNVWDWGTTLSGIAQADAQVEEARLARRKIADQVRVEARQAYVNAQTARDALDVARVAVSQAEENYRIVTRKFENAAATSFDVVDAEGLLTQARGQVETALYDYLIARAGVERATGAPLPGAP